MGSSSGTSMERLLCMDTHTGDVHIHCSYCTDARGDHPQRNARCAPLRFNGEPNVLLCISQYRYSLLVNQEIFCLHKNNNKKASWQHPDMEYGIEKKETERWKGIHEDPTVAVSLLLLPLPIHHTSPMLVPTSRPVLADHTLTMLDAPKQSLCHSSCCTAQLCTIPTLSSEHTSAWLALSASFFSSS